MLRLALFAITLSSLACSSGRLAPIDVNGQTLHGALALVDANTPYFATSVAPLDTRLLDQLMKQSTKALAAVPQVGDSKSVERRLRKLIEALFTEDGMRKYGLARQPRILIYGLEALPVLRISLLDSKRFDGFLLDALAKLEIPWEAQRISGHVVRRIQLIEPKNEGDERELILAQMYHGGDCVLTLADPEGIKRKLDALVGNTRPKQSLATSARLSRLLPASPTTTRYMVGSFDTLRLTEDLAFNAIVKPSALEDIRNDEQFMNQGRHQMRLFVSLFGPSDLMFDIEPTGQFTITLKQHLAPALRTYLKGLGVSIPGPDDMSKTLFDLTVGFRASAWSKMLSSGIENHLERLKELGYVVTKEGKPGRSAVEAIDPTEGSGAAPSKASKPIAKPILEPLDPKTIPAPMLQHHGVRLSLLSVNLDHPTPMSLLGSLRVALIVATDNPDQIIGLSQMHPMAKRIFTGVSIPNDGEPVALKNAPFPGLSILKTNKALALTFGGGVDRLTSNWLKTKELARPPLVSMHMDSTFLGKAINALADYNEQKATLKAKQRQRPTPEKTLEQAAALRAIASQLSASAQPISYSVTVEDDALVFRASQTMITGGD